MEIDKQNKKIKSVKCNLGSIKRNFTCLALAHDDEHIFAGTKTGDIMEVSLTMNLFKRLGPLKKLFSQGIQSIKLLSNGDLLLGAGDGTIAKVGSHDMLVKQ